MAVDHIGMDLVAAHRAVVMILLPLLEGSVPEDDGHLGYLLLLCLPGLSLHLDLLPDLEMFLELVGLVGLDYVQDLLEVPVPSFEVDHCVCEHPGEVVIGIEVVEVLVRCNEEVVEGVAKSEIFDLLP